MADDPTGISLNYGRTLGDDPAWRLLRIGLILFAAILLMRNGSYWAETLISMQIMRTHEAMSAIVEMVLLLVILVLASIGRPSFLKPLAWASAIYIVLVLANAILAILPINAGYLPGSRGLLRQIWVLASRVHILVMPTLCVLAATVFRELLPRE